MLPYLEMETLHVTTAPPPLQAHIYDLIDNPLEMDVVTFFSDHELSQSS